MHVQFKIKKKKICILKTRADFSERSQENAFIASQNTIIHTNYHCTYLIFIVERILEKKKKNNKFSSYPDLIVYYNDNEILEY